jgi:hypothetical protein
MHFVAFGLFSFFMVSLLYLPNETGFGGYETFIRALITVSSKFL